MIERCRFLLKYIISIEKGLENSRLDLRKQTTKETIF